MEGRLLFLRTSSEAAIPLSAIVCRRPAPEQASLMVEVQTNCFGRPSQRSGPSVHGKADHEDLALAGVWTHRHDAVASALVSAAIAGVDSQGAPDEVGS